MRPWLLACVLLAGCGSAEPEPVARLRLWTDAPGELEAPAPGSLRPVFSSRFETGLEGWRAVVNPGREPGGLEARVASEDGRAFLRLGGTHGGMLAVVPVEPDTCYVFTGEVRASGIETEAEPFDGARIWLGEASEDVRFEELKSTSREAMTTKWVTPPALGHDGWRPIRRVFVTSPGTRFLHVVCWLASRNDVRAGSAEFAGLALAAGGRETFWREALERESAARALIDGPERDWQRARRVSAELGAEHRPAIVLLPGDRLRLRLPRLAPGARLGFGAGAWPPAMLEGRGGELALSVRADGRELLARALAVPLRAADARWEEFELPLAEGTGVLELALEGASPLAIGAPLLCTSAAPPARPNVLLVSIDTLRADRVGAYANGLDTTPVLDRLARAGVLVRDASAPSPYTLPSHATLLTGQLPSVHGVVAHERRLSAARSTSLAEILGRAGYATRAFTAGGFVGAAFGLDRGFEAFSEVDPVREQESHAFRVLARKHGPERAARLLDEQGFAGVARWLRARRGEPFFLFLHTYTVHDYDVPARYLRCVERGCARPDVPPRTRTAAEAEAYTPAMRAHIQHVYDAALRYTDERLGQLLALLEKLGLARDTLVVVTSDHGEEFFERGALQHGRTLYQELLGIPLILSGAGLAPHVVERPVMLCDVVPTVLARLGLPRPEHLQGVDLLGPAWPARPIWSEVDDRFAHKYALREEDGRKTIHGPAEHEVQFPNERTWEQFDLGRDPREQHDLAGSDDPALGAARRRLAELRQALEELGASLGKLGEGELGDGTLQELDELGYGGD
jgi:arylsulfatase A-like enzyme